MDASSYLNLDDNELECRVCRSGPDLPSRPLYSPCLCSGSIALVHQDCLETWLTHAHKTKCELCGLKYQFLPQYAENTPSTLPLSVLFTTMIKKLINDYLPFSFRMIAAIVVWLGFVPLLTCQLYRMWMRLESFNMSSFPQRIPRDTVTGFVLASFVIFTFVVMMSFLDFIRVHRLPDEAGWRHPDGANLHHIPPQNPVPPPRVLRQEPPQPQPQPQPERDVQLPDQVHSDDSENYRPLENEHEDELESPNTTMLAQDLNNQHRIDNIPEEAELIDGAGADADLNGGGGDGGAGGGFDNDFDGFENELPPGEGEIQFALDELLGLRGVTHLLRNAWLLLAFNCVYIGLFASFPYMVGVSICRFVGQSSWVKASYAALQWLVPQSIVLASQVTTLSSSSEDALQFSDVVLVVLGYASLFFMIFALSETLYTLREVFSPSFLTNSILSLAALANVVKVGLLLLVRVFILPVILGIVVLVCANTFLGYGTNDWAVFISSNVVGSISLSWVAGISYMVSTTLTVLQLREILHPNILARNIRPQEPHFQLLLSLMYESTFTHCRRVLTSMMVYLSLLFVFVYTPMYVARHVQDMFSTAVESPSVDSVTTKSSANFPLYFNYYVPQIQIPFELAFAHLTFLTLLDRHKDKIGRMLFLWFTKVGKFFGVDRMLLPFYMIPYPPSLMYHDSKNSKFYKHANGSWYAGTQDGPLVRGPIVRPPPRWDDQNGRGVGRWAWGTETMSQLEMNVAPLVTPTFWALRLTALAFVTWAVIGVLVLCCVFLPLGFGRVVLKLMGVPFLWVHDPFCYSIGATAFWVLLSLVVDSTINLKVITPFMQVIRKMDMSVALLVAKLLLCWFTAELGIGVTIRTCLSSVPLSEPIAWPTRTLILGTYLKGVIISNAFLGLVFYGYLEKLLTFLDRAPDMVADEGTATTRVVDNRDPAIQAVDNWAKTVRNLLQKHILISSQENVWEFDVVRLEQLWSLLVKPLFTSSVVQTVGCYILVYAARYGSSVWLPSGVDKSNIDMLLGTTLRLLVLHSVATKRLLPVVMAILRVWWKHIYATVLDENYLVGRTLVNSNLRLNERVKSTPVS